MNDRDIFADAYVEQVLIEIGDHCGIAEDCDPDCNGGHHPVELTMYDLHPDTLVRLRTDAWEFFDAHAADLALYPGEHYYAPDQWAQRGGQLFWMDRSGHGVGFGDWYVHPMPDNVRDAQKRLMDACRTEGGRDMFRCTCGKITHGESWGEIQRRNAGARAS